MKSEDLEREEELIKNENAALLEIFKNDLQEKGISEKDIRSHISNAQLFLEEFLQWDEPEHFDAGLHKLDAFFHFFIHTCLWSTPETVGSTAESLRIFYECMMEHGKIEKDACRAFCLELQEGVPVWQKECAEYNEAALR